MYQDDHLCKKHQFWEFSVYINIIPDVLEPMTYCADMGLLMAQIYIISKDIILGLLKPS